MPAEFDATIQNGVLVRTPRPNKWRNNADDLKKPTLTVIGDWVWVALWWICATVYPVTLAWRHETTKDTIFDIAFCWGMALATLYYTVPTVRWFWKSMKSQPQIWIAIAGILAILFNVEIRIKALEQEMNWVKLQIVEMGKDIALIKLDVSSLQQSVAVLDNRYHALSKKVDEVYTKTMTSVTWLETVDTWFFAKLKHHVNIDRGVLGLGCFIKGTRVQVNELGKTKKVEKLKHGDYVWSPSLQRRVKIHTVVSGPEDEGYLYQIITNTGFNVVVTETHPMVICSEMEANNTDRDRDCKGVNKPASSVQIGQRTLTAEGINEITFVQKIPAKGQEVYNFMLDVEDHVPGSLRDVIADGIVTLDLTQQALNHHQKDTNS